MAWVIAARLLGPLLILRAPFAGGMFAAYLDVADWDFLRMIHQFSPVTYQLTDKYLDLYYAGFEFLMTFKWKNLAAKRVAWGLFVYRAIGDTIFISTGIGNVLLFFPNMFELFYLIHTGYQFFLRKEPAYSLRTVLWILLVLLIPKEFQEYRLHFNR